MTDVRAYSVADVLERLHLTPRTFRRQQSAGRLPMCVEILPRISSHHRLYRADVLDAYLSGNWRADGVALRRVSFGRRRV